MPRENALHLDLVTIPLPAPALSVKTRRTPFWHFRDAKVYGLKATAMHNVEYTPALPALPPVLPVPTSHLPGLHVC